MNAIAVVQLQAGSCNAFRKTLIRISLLLEFKTDQIYNLKLPRNKPVYCKSRNVRN